MANNFQIKKANGQIWMGYNVRPKNALSGAV